MFWRKVIHASADRISSWVDMKTFSYIKLKSVWREISKRMQKWCIFFVRSSLPYFELTSIRTVTCFWPSVVRPKYVRSMHIVVTNLEYKFDIICIAYLNHMTKPASFFIYLSRSLQWQFPNIIPFKTHNYWTHKHRQKCSHIFKQCALTPSSTQLSPSLPSSCIRFTCHW